MIYDDDVYSDDYDFNDNDRVNLEDPEVVDIELDDIGFEGELDNEPSPEIVMKGTPCAVLTKELKEPEYARGVLDFKYQGVNYQGVPMVKVNDNRFVFKLVSHDDKLKAFNLSEIRIG